MYFSASRGGLGRKVWTLVVAAPAVPCCPSSSSFALPDVFLIIRCERLHPGTVLRISWTRSFEYCVGYHVVRAGTFQCSPVVVGDTCEFENVIQCPNATPPPSHPMTTAFGSTGTESNEWARGLCPARLVSVGGKSGVKVTAASTVRGSASLIPSIPSWPRGTPSSTGPWGPR